MDKTYIDWDTFHKDCDVTAVKVSANFPNVDYMVALSRGGLVPARIMAEIVKPKNFLTLGLKLYDNQTAGDKVEITQELGSIIHEFDRHDRVLIVDDISDRGTTLGYAYSYMFRMTGGAHIYSACPYIKTSTTRVPSAYCKEFPDDEWIVFPFEKD